MPYQSKIRCYSCRRLVKGTLYVEREINPYAYVSICEKCAPTWHLVKDLQKLRLIEYIPHTGIRLNKKGKRVAEFLKACSYT